MKISKFQLTKVFHISNETLVVPLEKRIALRVAVLDFLRTSFCTSH